jgi:hypothetical protein
MHQMGKGHQCSEQKDLSHIQRSRLYVFIAKKQWVCYFYGVILFIVK